jgi:O-antigen/teichoic acid export membrane protein
MIEYLGEEQFGIWATMLTLLTWVMLFDFGVGNGLKNKISENNATKSDVVIGEYISTAYVLVGLVVFILVTTLLILSAWVPWQSVFNTSVVSEDSLRNIVQVLGFFIFFNFWASLITQIYSGFQKTSFVVLGQLVSNGFSLAIVFVLNMFVQANMIFMAFGYGFSLLASNLLLSYIFFRKNIFLFPRIRRISRDRVSSLFLVSSKFFAIQIAMLLIFMTDKMLITQLIGPQHVTPYEVLFKLFSIINVIHHLILTPMWPAYSEAYSLGDISWIKVALKNQIKIAFILIPSAFLLATAGPLIVDLWVGGTIDIGQRVYYIFAFFIALSVWGNVFSYLANAFSRLNVQLIAACLAAVVNIIFSIYFVKVLGFGLEGIIMATSCSLMIYSFAGPVEIYFIFRRLDNMHTSDVGGQ